MTDLLFDVQGVDDSTVFDKGTVAFVQNYGTLFLRNHLKKPNANVKVTVTDDLVMQGKTQKFVKKGKIDIDEELSKDEVHQFRDFIITLLTVWRQTVRGSASITSKSAEQTTRHEPSQRSHRRKSTTTERLFQSFIFLFKSQNGVMNGWQTGEQDSLLQEMQAELQEHKRQSSQMHSLF